MLVISYSSDMLVSSMNTEKNYNLIKSDRQIKLQSNLILVEKE